MPSALPSAAAFADPVVAAGVVGLQQRFAQGLSTALHATRVYLARIDRHDAALHAFLDLDRAGALAAATASDARRARGAPLSLIDGVPVAVKANMAVRGLPWTGGLAGYRTRIATDDAACVARLRAAGAVVLGTMAMDEGALGASGDNPTYGRTHNPHRHGHSPGGSSAGSAAAVAAGLCAAALGTDTLGSVRIPAAYCGVVGHSPRHGTVDAEGVVPLSWTLDNVGVLARSVRDAACLLAVLATPRSPTLPPDRPAATAQPVAALVWPESLAVQAPVAAAFEQALDAARACGLVVQPLRLVGFESADAIKTLLRIVQAEGWAAHEPMLRAQADGLSPGLRRMLEWGAGQSAGSLARAGRDARALAASIRAQLAPFAGLLAPVTPQQAFAFDGPPPLLQAAFTVIGSVAGLSGISLPMATRGGGRLGSDGAGYDLPTALQVLALHNTPAIALAQQLEAALPGPPVPGAYAD
jgi:aspartyl-tRNA(Asn)/glutamyl-tRNA(Gln) amidotransferase subunit A